MNKSITINTYTDEETGQVKPFPKIVRKGWGLETWLVNNDLYCGKILQFNKRGSFSMHYHVKKDEAFYVLSGQVEIEYYNLDNADLIIQTLYPGKSIRISPSIPHKITALEASTIIEISTPHDDADSFRIAKGDSQK